MLRKHCFKSDKSDKNSEKWTVLLIVNLQFSDFLQFGNLAIWSHFGEWNHNPNRHVLFLEKFEQTKIGDLRALPEIWKSWSTEILSNYVIIENKKIKRGGGSCLQLKGERLDWGLNFSGIAFLL